MLRNYILIALRNIHRQLTYSIINVVGLAIGIACSLVIFIFVYGEWSYDRSFSNGDQVYRVGISFFNIGNFANGPERLLELLPGEFPGIETASRVKKDPELPITYQSKTFFEQAYYTDSAFFKIFDFSFVSGNRNNVLTKPNEIVLTESMAKKIFNRTNVLGELVQIGKEKVSYSVTGIVKDPDFNTHFKSNIWLSIQSQLTGATSWSSAAFYNYILLRPGVVENDLREALNNIFVKNVYPEAGVPGGFKTIEDYRNNENAIKFIVYSLKDIYLKSKLNLEISPGGNENNIYIFSAISLFIILLAGVNFVNLTTARASRRAREVGIRKTLGTTRAKLIAQFMMESVLTSLLAMGMALVFSELFLMLFETITGSPLLTSIWSSGYALLLLLIFAIVVGLLSGVYPSFYLTSFDPARVLKGNVSVSGGEKFRNLLVVAQFSVSIVLIVCAVVVQQQLHFMQTKDLGFEQDNIVTIDKTSLLKTSGLAYKNELEAFSGVENSSFHMGEPGSSRPLAFYTFQTPEMQSAISIRTYFADDNYISLMGFKLLRGRNFSKELPSDTLGVIFNEAAVRALYLGDNPIGATINKDQSVIGVINDFHWESLRSSIAPLAIVLSNSQSQLGFKLQSSAIPGFLKVAEEKWKALVPDEPFQYHFMDNNFGELLKKEAVFGKAINFFTALAIFISCLGLYGLSAFTAEQRTREIGIRKVFGATTGNIVLMLNRKFSILVLIASVLSVPVSLYVMNRWLQEFAFRITLDTRMVIFSVLLAFVMAWATVSFHSFKATRVNPADTLKYE